MVTIAIIVQKMNINSEECFRLVKSLAVGFNRFDEIDPKRCTGYAFFHEKFIGRHNKRSSQNKHCKWYGFGIYAGA